jgi:hypothetical protein
MKVVRGATTLLLFLAATCCGIVQARAQQGSEDAATRVDELIRQFLAAEEAFDPKALANLIEPGYFEVSPVGEVDEHDRFLAFYTPDKRVDYPPSTLSEEHMELYDYRTAAVYSVKITYAMKNPDGSQRAMEVRGTFVARNVGVVNGANTWRMVSAVYTPVRSKPKQS